jgi:hypothetical protein
MGHESRLIIVILRSGFSSRMPTFAAAKALSTAHANWPSVTIPG